MFQIRAMLFATNYKFTNISQNGYHRWISFGRKHNSRIKIIKSSTINITMWSWILILHEHIYFVILHESITSIRTYIEQINRKIIEECINKTWEILNFIFNIIYNITKRREIIIFNYYNITYINKNKPLCSLNSLISHEIRTNYFQQIKENYNMKTVSCSMDA